MTSRANALAFVFALSIPLTCVGFRLSSVVLKLNIALKASRSMMRVSKTSTPCAASWLSCSGHAAGANGIDAGKQHGMRYPAAYMSLLVLDELDGPGGIVLIERRALRGNDNEIGCRHGMRGPQIGNAFGIDNDKGCLLFRLLDQVEDRILFARLDDFKIAGPHPRLDHLAMGALGSASITITRAPFASSAARRRAEVDFPAPPLGVINAMVGIACSFRMNCMNC